MTQLRSLVAPVLALIPLALLIALSAAHAGWGVPKNGALEAREQLVSVSVRSADGDVKGARCVLSNDLGAWFIAAPDAARVLRSREALLVKCDAVDFEPGGLERAESVDALPATGHPLGSRDAKQGGVSYVYPDSVSVTLVRLKRN